MAIYPLYAENAELKGRTKNEVDEVICWLTGYSQKQLLNQIDEQCDLRTFFAKAPQINPKSDLIKGVTCGVRIEELEKPLMIYSRYLDKLIDELAKGRTMDKIFFK